jgi:hypothetical protein
MNTRNIVIGIILVVLVYVLYMYFFSSGATTLVSTHDARSLDIISANKLPAGATSDYTYSIWMYINDWNYRFGESKVIFGRVDQNNDPAPSVTLAPSNNDLNVTLAVYPNEATQSSGQSLYTCSIKDIPLQRWTNLIMSLNNRAMDLYLDGKLVKTCVMPGVPKMNPSSNIMLCPDGGFSGYVSNFKYLPNAVNPSQAYDIYKAGYGGGSALSGLFNKYRVKVAFVEDNKEVNSLEL